MTELTATYRLQFRNGMTFAKAEKLVPYFRRLGISHVYASPLQTAVRGSSHGYDITRPDEIDPAIGGIDGFRAFSATLKAAGLGLVVDIVPNHLAASLETPWWRDVIEWGEASRYARHFDIDWTERLTLPVLDRPFGEAVRHGDIRLTLDPEAGCLAFAAAGCLWPLGPPSYLDVLMPLANPLAERLAELAQAAPALSIEGFRAGARQLLQDRAAVQRLDSTLASLSADRARLAAIHEQQSYRFICWKDAARHLSYRRFFEIAGLVGVRVEDPVVHDDMHRLVHQLVDEGCIDALRIDHVDGLADPAAYLARLRQTVGDRMPILVEKILADGEHLPADWPVEGTTGYESMVAMTRLFVDAAGLPSLTAAYRQVTRMPHAPKRDLLAIRAQLLAENFRGEMSALVQLALRALAAAGERRRFSADRLRIALSAILVHFPVYRTYGTAEGLFGEDRSVLEQAVTAAHADVDEETRAAVDFLRHLLEEQASDASKARQLRTRFQQLSGPLMAKSLEDTLFYRDGRLIALNEVGAPPAAGALSLEDFHAFQAERQRIASQALSPLSTHDAKRGEDARLRIASISEAPERFADLVSRLAREPQVAAHLAGGEGADPAFLWFFLQSLLGIWPAEGPPAPAQCSRLAARVLPFVEKALREAKQKTRWTQPDTGFEAAVAVLATHFFSSEAEGLRAILTDAFAPYLKAGAVHGVAQAVLNCGAAGVPDVYQGSESLNFNLVDPDNRRMPDFGRLDSLLEAGTDAANGQDPLVTGALKLHAMQRCLLLRKLTPGLFLRGTYKPVEAAGHRARHIVAYCRTDGETSALFLGLRFCLDLDADGDFRRADWQDTRVPLRAIGRSGTLVDILTRRRFEARDPLAAEVLFATYPAAVLVSRTGGG